MRQNQYDRSVQGHRTSIDFFVRRTIPVVDQISGMGERQEDPVEDHNRHRVCQQGRWPAQPGAINIAVAIDRPVADSQADGGPEIEFYDDIPIDVLPSKLQTAVFSIVQELLCNACRHSNSRNVLVGLVQDDERISIQVQDWGIGFDVEWMQPHTRGLKGIQQVVRWLGGAVDVDSRPGVGTCIVVEIPLSQENGLSDSTCEHRPR
jgi:signal transduction histidine kinase